MNSLLKRYWLFITAFLLIIIFFWKFIFKGLIPFPADIVLGIYYPWLDYSWGFITGVPVKNPLLADIPSIIYPWRSFAIDQFKNGQLPLWNPLYFGGMPLMANFQSAVFSYINLLYLFLPKIYAWSLGIIIQPSLGILFMYIYLRNRQLEKISSLLGGMIFAFSGFSITWLEFNLLGHSALFLPVLLFVIDKFFSTKKNYWLFFFSILIALQILTGYLPIVIFSYLIILFYLLFFYHRQYVQLIKVLIFWLMGILLTSFQLLPGIELILHSIRNDDVLTRNTGIGYLPLKNLLTVIMPDLFGNPATGNWWGKGYYDNYSFYVGIIAMVLAGFAFLKARTCKFVKFWLILISLSLIMSTDNVIARMINTTLFLKGGIAARALFIADFSLSILSGIGLNILIKNKDKIAGVRLTTLLLTIISILAVTISLLSKTIANPSHRTVFQNNIIVPSLFFLISIPIFYALTLGNLNIKKISSYVLFFLIFLNLFYSGNKYLSYAKSDLVFPTTPVIEFIQNQNQPFRIEIGDTIPPNFWMMYGFETMSGYDTLRTKRMAELLSAVEKGEITDEVSRIHLLRNYNSPILPLFNIKYYLIKKNDANFDRSRYSLVFEDKSLQVYEDSKALPRLFFAYKYGIAKEKNKIIEKMQEKDFDVSKTIILENKIEPVVSGNKPINNLITWELNNPNNKRLKVFTSSQGFLFLGDNYYPGWRAYIDNKETKIYRADYTFRAIMVNEGEHEVKFIYDPISFKMGLVMSMIALVVLGLSFTRILFINH